MGREPAAGRFARRGITARTAQLLGVPVGLALPVQRHRPRTILVACAAEFAALAALALTGSPPALAALAAAAAALAVLAVTNRKRILAFTGEGVVVVRASGRRHPVAPLGPAPAGLALPAARGTGAPVELDGGRWWVDRADYARLRRAAELLSR